ncbi:MAG TPA: helix-turn-helix domain-containing protein [Streptosporangiaceae bacterium]|nr:helix-turn-helix domain-containing protein [Streptosporangiaceae bacterium]
MQLRYTYRLYPTPGQRDALARAFGCARVVFNDGLDARQEAHAAGLPYITDAELSARLTAAKQTLERAWPVRAHQPGVLSMRRQGRSQAAARPCLAMPRVRGMAGPGHRCGGQRR